MRHRHRGLGHGILGARIVEGDALVFHRVGRDCVLACRIAVAVINRRGILECRFGLAHHRLGLMQRRRIIGIVPRDHAARLDLLAFLEIHFRDFADDLGRQRRLAPRHHITAGIQTDATRRALGRPQTVTDSVTGHAIVGPEEIQVAAATAS